MITKGQISALANIRDYLVTKTSGDPFEMYPDRVDEPETKNKIIAAYAEIIRKDDGVIAHHLIHKYKTFSTDWQDYLFIWFKYSKKKKVV